MSDDITVSEAICKRLMYDTSSTSGTYKLQSKEIIGRLRHDRHTHSLSEFEFTIYNLQFGIPAERRQRSDYVNLLDSRLLLATVTWYIL